MKKPKTGRPGRATGQAGRMTEAEHREMLRLGRAFSAEFAELCERYLARMPARLRGYLELYLDTLTSVVGRRRKS